MIGTINPRKTFAIISHPDAGKTTLTEKLLLFGGAIQQAGAVKARGENRHARSDWMKVEQERFTLSSATGTKRAILLTITGGMKALPSLLPSSLT